MERPANMQTLDFAKWKRQLARNKQQLVLNENWLDTQEVCQTLRISRATLRRRVIARVIPEPSRHLGEYLPRWPESEIDKLMDSPKG